MMNNMKIKRELEEIENVIEGRMDQWKGRNTLVILMKDNLSKEQRYIVLENVIRIGEVNGFIAHKTTHWVKNWLEVVY